MKTINEIKEMLASEKQQSEVVEMLLEAEALRRRINRYLQSDRTTNIDNWRREKLADASEDIYTVEYALGEVIGHNITASLVSDWQ